MKPTMSDIWIDAKQQLPTKDGNYLTFTQTKSVESVGLTLFSEGQFMSSFVTFWAELQRPDTEITSRHTNTH
jgi:hypothetical protein